MPKLSDDEREYKIIFDYIGWKPPTWKVQSFGPGVKFYYLEPGVQYLPLEYVHNLARNIKRIIAHERYADKLKEDNEICKVIVEQKQKRICKEAQTCRRLQRKKMAEILKVLLGEIHNRLVPSVTPSVSSTSMEIKPYIDIPTEDANDEFGNPDKKIFMIGGKDYHHLFCDSQSTLSDAESLTQFCKEFDDQLIQTYKIPPSAISTDNYRLFPFLGLRGVFRDEIESSEMPECDVSDCGFKGLSELQITGKKILSPSQKARMIRRQRIANKRSNAQNKSIEKDKIVTSRYWK